MNWEGITVEVQTDFFPTLNNLSVLRVACVFKRQKGHDKKNNMIRASFKIQFMVSQTQEKTSLQIHRNDLTDLKFSIIDFRKQRC